MIYTDGVHLVSSDDVNELHEFALKKLDFKLAWFQDKHNQQRWYPHYDLTTKNAKRRALEAGAMLVSAKEIIEILRNAPYNWFCKKCRRYIQRTEGLFAADIKCQCGTWNRYTRNGNNNVIPFISRSKERLRGE